MDGMLVLDRNRYCTGGGCEGLPVYHRSAGEDVQREGGHFESAGRRDRTNAHCCHVRFARKSHLRRPATQSRYSQFDDPRSGIIFSLIAFYGHIFIGIGLC